MRTRVESRFISDERRTHDYDSVVDSLMSMTSGENAVDADRAIAEGLESYLRDSFLQAASLKVSKKYPCLRELAGIRCDHMNHRKCLPSGCDHTTVLASTKGTNGIIVTQPYLSSLSVDKLAEMKKFCDEIGIHMTIGVSSSWHFYGKTVLIGFCRKPQPS